MGSLQKLDERQKCVGGRQKLTTACGHAVPKKRRNFRRGDVLGPSWGVPGTPRGLVMSWSGPDGEWQPQRWAGMGSKTRPTQNTRFWPFPVVMEVDLAYYGVSAQIGPPSVREYKFNLTRLMTPQGGWRIRIQNSNSVTSVSEMVVRRITRLSAPLALSHFPVFRIRNL